MELKDIKELMAVLKKEEMAEMKVRYGKIKLTLVNSDVKKEEVKVKKVIVEEKTENKAIEETIKSKNVGEIKLNKVEKGMEVTKGMLLAKINTIGVETDIKSPVKGILKDILVADKSTVDYGKSLFVIEITE